MEATSHKSPRIATQGRRLASVAFALLIVSMFLSRGPSSTMAILLGRDPFREIRVDPGDYPSASNERLARIFREDDESTYIFERNIMIASGSLGTALFLAAVVIFSVGSLSTAPGTKRVNIVGLALCISAFIYGLTLTERPIVPGSLHGF
ncbi:MAG: hypothetical protein JSS66_04120 [Armatimonadetes bacterium]|nr:hypothetical protein [Armatimonadota bacterium]